MNIILNHNQINHKLKRIAYQIYESNFNESEIVLAGISHRGFDIAKLLKDILESISPLQIILCEVLIDKKNPLKTIKTSIPKSEYTNKSIVLFFFVSLLSAQFKEATVSFDDRLLKADEKVSLLQLQTNINKFYEYTVWKEEKRDLEIKSKEQRQCAEEETIDSTQE